MKINRETKTEWGIFMDHKFLTSLFGSPLIAFVLSSNFDNDFKEPIKILNIFKALKKKTALSTSSDIVTTCNRS